MYINIEVTLQVNVEVIIILILKKRIIISIKVSNENKHVNFTQGPYDDFPYKWLMKNGTPVGGGKITYGRF